MEVTKSPHQGRNRTTLQSNQIKHSMNMGRGVSPNLPIDLAFKPLLPTSPKLTMAEQQHLIFKHHNN